eukprot:scaffold6351_cov166-Amphora_coffeaeformis.AAC.9
MARGRAVLDVRKDHENHRCGGAITLVYAPNCRTMPFTAVPLKLFFHKGSSPSIFETSRSVYVSIQGGCGHKETDLNCSK